MINGNLKKVKKLDKFVQRNRHLLYKWKTKHYIYEHTGVHHTTDYIINDDDIMKAKAEHETVCALKSKQKKKHRLKKTYLCVHHTHTHKQTRT